MDWQLEALMAARAIVAACLGGFIGWERERHGREAGIRTYAAVSLGSCVFGLVSSHIEGAEPSRIASNVVTGIGFIGAGVILRGEGSIIGLTTAATLWTTAAVGLSIAYGMYVLGTLAALIVFLVLYLHHLDLWKRLTGHHEYEHEPDS